MKQVTAKILSKIYKERDKASKKYDFGFVNVIGGSEFYSGAPALSAFGALKAGADMIRVIAPKRAADIIASFSPALAAFPLSGSYLSFTHIATLTELVESSQEVSHNHASVVIGAGLGRSKETQKAIVAFLQENTLPVVIDADALYALPNNPACVKGSGCVLTPHSYEFLMLTGVDLTSLSHKERVEQVCKAAAAWGCIILLKGSIDIISDGTAICENTAGTPYMTVGGTGDVLAGIIGTFLARGINSMVSAEAGAFINGKAGEIASKTLKESLIVTDVVNAIPAALALSY